MALDEERAAVEGDREDRISDLPRNVRDHILEHLPVQDAARTSILSRKWRYIWATLPNLVLDYDFCCKLTEKSKSNFKEVVDDIMLLHTGDIVKFDLDARGAHLPSYAVIDRWALYVTRNGVKELTLCISNDDTYTLPSSIFNCSTLTHLNLFKCVFKPPNPFLGFQNLITLHLEETTFVPSTSFRVINAPLLANLVLNLCRGTRYLNIVSPGLESLYVNDRHSYLVLDCFMNCRNLRGLDLEFYGVFDSPTNGKISSLEKLLVSSPALEVLHLDSFVVELLSADVVPNGIPFTLKCLWRLSLGVDFSKMGPISYALELIKNSPNLSKLEIWVHGSSNNAEAILKYLDTPSCLEQSLNKLEYVVISYFGSSKAEVLFVKLLLSHTPSLLSMCIGQYKDINVDIALEIDAFSQSFTQGRAILFRIRG